VEETVHAALASGLTGAAVTDCRVTLIRSGFDSVLSTAADFRGLTPIVLRRALARAGTVLYEPYLAFEAEVPPDALAAVTGLLASLGADVSGTAGGDPAWFVTGELPARRAREAELRLPGITRGEAVWSARPSADRPVRPGR
ncbi:GTP-binding protein, partial [Streptomyces sp. SID6013]|nr:GTP-binding protein [Streptomyces sp. SID6013]